MKKMRVAIIGQGRSGRDIHGAFFRSHFNEHCEVVAVVDEAADRRERAAAEYEGCRVYANYTALFGCKDIDLVVNASFSNQHYCITKDLLQHGFNVLVEKPFAANYYECCDLMKTAEDNHVVLAVFQQSLLAPHHLGVKQTIAEGKLGEIKQISIHYNGLARRWDWQTLQCMLAGSVYNTGPHPIGMALDYLGFDDHAKVVYSRLDTTLTSGDAEDYAKILMTAPGKPLIDIEISAIDAYNDYTVKLQGTKGTYSCTTSAYKMRYIVDGENEPRPVMKETLRKPDGTPSYCVEQLITHEETGKFEGSAFDVAVRDFYNMVYDRIFEGKEMFITPAMIARVVNVIEKVHADNPLPVKF